MCRLIKKILVHLLHSAHGWWGGRGGAMPRMCYYTYSTLEIGCHRVHLTDRWSAHLTRLSLHSLTAPDLKSIHNEIKWRGRRARLSVESKNAAVPSRADVAGPPYWNYTSHNSPFCFSTGRHSIIVTLSCSIAGFIETADGLFVKYWMIWWTTVSCASVLWKSGRCSGATFSWWRAAWNW